MQQDKEKLEKLLSMLDDTGNVTHDPVFTAKVMHVHNMQVKGQMFSSKLKATAIGFAMLLILMVNGISLVKGIGGESTGSATSRIQNVKQLSETYFSYNE